MPQPAVDAYRVLNDYDYAATLNNDQWLSLASNPDFHTLVADDPLLGEQLIARFGVLVPGFAAALAAPASAPLAGTVGRAAPAGKAPGLAAPLAASNLVGTRVDRVH